MKSAIVQSAPTQEPRPRWARFAIVDMMVLVLSSALGCFLISLSGAAVAWKLAFGLLIGALPAVPLLLISQYLFRARRHKVFPGEKVGMVPLGGVLGSLFLVFHVPSSDGLIFLWLSIWLGVQTWCFVCAMRWLFLSAIHRRREPWVPWTDHLGSILCVVTTPIPWILILAILGWRFLKIYP